jgi:hypothetical protein
MSERSLAGRTIRWTFDDGPTAGTTYEHTFSQNGTVTWRDVNAKKQPATSGKKAGSGDGKEAADGKEAKEGKATDGKAANGNEPWGVPYASYEVAPDVHLVSYLSDSGYTLTVTLNLETLQCSGVASNDKEWYPSTGTIEVVH